MRRWAFFFLAIAPLLLLRAGDASAESGATLVALVTSEPESPVTRRVRAELEGLGVDVIVLRPPGEGSPSREPLEIAARNVGATAAVRIIASGTTTEVWVADRATGKTVIRELAPKTQSDTAVAIGAVELLRASLMELHAVDAPRGEVPATESLRALALPPAPDAAPPSAVEMNVRLGLAVGAGIDVGMRGALAPSSSAAFALWLAIYRRAGVRAFGSWMWNDDTVITREGTVRAHAQLFGAEATYDLLPSDGALVPVLGFGVALTHAVADGAASAPYVGASVDAWCAGPLAHAGVAWTFVPGLRLRADAVAAWAFTPAHIRTVSDDIGTMGAPTVFLSMGFELMWRNPK